ncbi:MAG: hypothetical protein ACYC6C_08050 [Coriobacteriia bacterium]
MTDSFSIDFSEISTLVADLGQIAGDAGPNVRKAVEVTARNVKDAWAEKLQGENGVPHAPRSITYDIKGTPGAGKSVIEAEIGAEQGRLQAPIVTVLEYGAPGNNLPPRGYGAGALFENRADFVKGLRMALGDAERSGGFL